MVTITETSNSITLDSLIDCFIPYLLYQGYSNTSISDIAYRFCRKNRGNSSPAKIIEMFDGSKKPYVFLIKTTRGTDEFREILDYLDAKRINYKETTTEKIQNNLFDDFSLKEDETLYIIRHSTLDPHNYLRNLYEISLKNFVAANNRLSLQYFTNFLDNVYWGFDRIEFKFQKSNLSIDPINVPKRKSSLSTTLSNLSQSFELNFADTSNIPVIREIRDSLYYYHLALGSKSIENSLSLLWTSLETLLPYRLKDNDIENIQYFVSKSLSIGAIGREITSFANRFINTHRYNDNPLGNLGLYTNYLNYTPEGIKKWLEWLSVDYSASHSSDPYHTLKPVSNLLCRQFCFLNSVFNGTNRDHKTAQYWLDKIVSSETSITYQLDRIYLHRNQIVHSGKFINEYSNLWNHLEWYVGKLLSYCVFNYIRRPDKENFKKEEIFMQLEADSDTLRNMLENNKHKLIKDLSFTYNLICKHSWQFF